MASNLIAMASNLIAMASNLIAMASTQFRKRDHEDNTGLPMVLLGHDLSLIIL